MTRITPTIAAAPMIMREWRPATVGFLSSIANERCAQRGSGRNAMMWREVYIIQTPPLRYDSALPLEAGRALPSASTASSGVGA